MPQVNIDTIKTGLKSLLDTANTTTGTPVDLSAGMNTRVARVLKIHPGRIPIQPSFFPYVSMFISDKKIEQVTFGTRGTQASSLRQGLLSIQIVGCCYEPFFTDLNEDQGAENVEKLMENIEEIIRTTPNLNYTSTAWATPDRVQYDDVPYDEEAHLRAGILTLDFKVHY